MTKEHSKRITLGLIRGGRFTDSFNEGEYVRGGIAAALEDARAAARRPTTPGIADAIAVCVFSIDPAKPSRVVAQFPLPPAVQPMTFLVCNDRGGVVAQFLHAEDAAQFVGGQDDYSVRTASGHMLWWEGHEIDSAAESFDGAALVMFDRMARVSS